MRKPTSKPVTPVLQKTAPSRGTQSESEKANEGKGGKESKESKDSFLPVDWAQAQKVKLPNLRPTTKTISLRLPQHLLDSIKVAANARDVPYQSLIKVWLQEKLHNH